MLIDSDESLRKMKINLYIIVPNFKGGGSERVILSLIKNIDKEKFNITVICGSKTGEYVKDIPTEIKVIDLKKERVRKAIFPIIKIIKNEQPDLVLSTLGHLNLLIALFIPYLPRKTKFVARESNTVSLRNKDEAYPLLFNFLFKTVYRRFNLVICQAGSMKSDLNKNYGFPSKKMVIINNPIEFKRIENLNDDHKIFNLPTDKFNLLIVGRLTKQKRVDHAIKVMSYLPDHYHLTVIGEGELECQLTQLINELGLQKKVTLTGFMSNPYYLYKKANLLLSTSRYEGFPNVVLEANACGLPVIAYNYVGGINEIIVEGLNGNLVENGNISDLSQCITKAATYRYNKEAIIEMTKERFDVEIIVKKYETELLKLT